MYEPGDRVGAISHGKDGTLYIFGYGVYDGDFVPETAAGWMGEACQEVGASNPRITLDSGKVVWGCECWWGSESRVREYCEKFKKVVEIDIEEARARLKSQSTEKDI
jgi:hypothetical protein